MYYHTIIIGTLNHFFCCKSEEYNETVICSHKVESKTSAHNDVRIFLIWNNSNVEINCSKLYLWLVWYININF